MENTNIGRRILDRLAVIDKSQAELAKEVGVGESTLSRYIAGSRTPSCSVVVRVARALQVTTDYLLMGEAETDFETEYLRVLSWIRKNAGKLSAEQRFALAKPVFQ